MAGPEAKWKFDGVRVVHANELDPNGDRADMGVFGDTAEASKSAR